MTDAEAWIRRYHPSDASEGRLVCFPHAGGSASYYYPVSERFSPAIDVIALQYPGRQDRRQEACIKDINVLADEITEQLVRLGESPTLLFGHSMGATLAFEVAWRLEERGRNAPLRVIASGRSAPGIVRSERIHQRDDAGVIAEIRRLNGTDSTLLENEEILRMSLPAIRGDYQAIETYTYTPGRILTSPITVLTGDSDPRTTIEQADAWRCYTEGPFRMRVFPGGHFYLSSNIPGVTAEIASDLEQVINQDSRRRAPLVTMSLRTGSEHPGPTMTNTVEFPFRRPGQPFPPPEYADYRRQGGLVKARLGDGQVVWLVTRQADVRAVLTSKRISSNPDRKGFPNFGPTLGVPRSDQIPGWFVGFDPPEHGRVRKALIPEFSARRIRALRPAIQRTVDERIDAMLAKGGKNGDLVAEFALPVPSLVISALLGVPQDDRGFFESRTRTLLAAGSSTDQQRETAVRELLRYVNRLIALKQRWPGDDMISRLLATGVMSGQELSGALLLLLIAGHETTANNIALGVVTLLMHPKWIGDAPDRVVEELLRLHSVADLVALRVATGDVEIAGQLIRAGEGIVPLVAAANHDESIYACPHEFDPARQAQQHVAFGYGAHRCLGENLVRAELEIAYRTLFERVPDLRLAVSAEQLPFKYDGVIFGVHELPVTW